MLIDKYCYGNKYYFGSTELWLTDWLLPEGLLRFALNLVGNNTVMVLNTLTGVQTEMLEARPEIEGMVHKYCNGIKYYFGSQQ